ncbi:MAG: glycerol-3-phosphate dehydrogenase/oxidase [Thermoplasmatota archaeon]
MERDFTALGREEFDVLVIGGGINGAGAARDAARRGLKVALVEKEDFGYGTTGHSTRLIHGGLRYLALYDFALVRESLRERELLLRNAPHLVRPLRFLVPVYEETKPSGAKLRLGLTLYDVLSFGKSLPNHTWLGREDALRQEPGLNRIGLQGALVFWDAQVPFVERLCLDNAMDAAQHGAVIVTHALLETLRVEGDRVVGGRVRDLLPGPGDRPPPAGGAVIDVRARMVVNASGPWLSDVLAARIEMASRASADAEGMSETEGPTGRRATAQPAASMRPVARMTKGIHVVVPLHTQNAIVLFSPDDDRLFFSIPWNGLSLLGTTDTDFNGDLDRLHAEEEEVQYLLRSASKVFPNAPRDVVFTYAGVRSLLNVEGVSEGEITRRHLILDHARTEGLAGLVTIVGGKITPYRLVCEETVDAVERHLGLDQKGDTARHPLADVAELRGLPDRLVMYGDRARRIMAYERADPMLAERVCEHAPDTWAQVRFAADEEMALTLADVLIRRTTLGWAPCLARHVAAEVAAFVARRLGWSPERTAQEIEAYTRACDDRSPTRSPPGTDSRPTGSTGRMGSREGRGRRVAKA